MRPASGSAADLGAEVIKGREPAGDDTPHLGPALHRTAGRQGRHREGGSLFLHGKPRQDVGRLRFRRPEDLTRLKALIAEADVVVESFKVGG
jgi:crotonobetainyl-CoA:carnitine CoA-transferase CaiB-like acyl-CoA transferase